MNDIKLLDFPQLARDFQQAYALLRDEQLRLQQAVLDRRRQQQYNQLVQQFDNYDSEAGSDGIEESIQEALGEPPQAKLPENILQQCKTTAKLQVAEAWCAKNSISQKLTWLPHQLLAYFGTWRAERDESGMYSAQLTLDLNVRQRTDYYALGSMLLATSARTNFFKDAPKGNQQYKSVINPLVPIILAGFKKYQNIGYSEWNPVGLEALLDPELAKLVGVKVPELSLGELLALRNTALTDKQGARAGIPNNPATCIKLNHLGDTALGHLPKLAKYMMLQTWAAHPSNRNEYMILDPNNWDAMPEPLVSKDIFVAKPAKAVASFTGSDLPWEA
jgi:hypothetical protein